MMGNLPLLDELAGGSIEWLEPSYDAETGGVSYPSVGEFDECLGEPLPTALETLAARGVLERAFVDRVIACPDCGSDTLGFRMVCPECGSSNTAEIAVIEHTGCGCVRPREQFEVDGSYLCPECEADIESVEAECERMGTVHRCRECGERSNALANRLDCEDCGVYAPEETHTVQLYRYRFDETRRPWLDGLLAGRDGAAEALDAREYDVEPNAVLTGRSGEEHVVDLYAADPAFGVEIIVSVCESIDADRINRLRRVADATRTQPVLATTATTRNDTAEELAAQNGIRVLRVDENGDAEMTAESSGKSGRRTLFRNAFSRVTGTDDSSAAKSP